MKPTEQFAITIDDPEAMNSSDEALFDVVVHDQRWLGRFRRGMRAISESRPTPSPRMSEWLTCKHLMHIQWELPICRVQRPCCG